MDRKRKKRNLFFTSYSPGERKTNTETIGDRERVRETKINRSIKKKKKKERNEENYNLEKMKTLFFCL